MEFNVNNKKINIFCGDSDIDLLPVIIINSYDNDSKDIWDRCRDISNQFIFVSISGMNWNNDLTPWKTSPVYKNDSGYLGKANNYLKEIEDNIIPIIDEYVTNFLNKRISYYGIIGYSLAGLFALYSGFNSNKFKRIASVSGSLWYPNFLDYVKTNKISDSIDRIYLSLGNKECKTNNEIISTVEDRTIEIYNYLNNFVESYYEENDGNHFKDAIIRVTKAIRWLLK